MEEEVKKDEWWLNTEIVVPLFKKYLVSEGGKVFTIKNGARKYITGTLSDGYMRISIMTDQGPRKFYVHKLVAQMFIPNTDKSKRKVIHLDHAKTNNEASNLKWVTDMEAMEHQLKQYPGLPQSSRKNQ